MDMLKFSLLCGTFMFHNEAIFAQMCTAVSNFDNVRIDKAISGSSFLTLRGFGLVGCSKQCLLRSACQSFNYEPSTQECQLNKNSSSTTGDGYLVNSAGTVSSDRSSWPSVIAGVCNSTSCPANSLCIENGGNAICKVECHDPELENGTFTSPITHEVDSALSYDCDAGLMATGHAQCQPDGTWTAFSCLKMCVDPPVVERGTFISTESQWAPGTVLGYVCMDDYVPLGKVMCEPDGEWTEMTCIRAIRDCTKLLQCNSSYLTGEYWLSPLIFRTQPVKIYCEVSDIPKEYLTLPEENSVDYSDTNCDPVNRRWRYTGCESARFNKLKISDIKNMKTNKSGARDYKFLNTSNTCYYTQFGGVNDCHAHADCNQVNTREFVINTKGTGLKVSPLQKWSFEVTTTLTDSMKVTKEDGGRKIVVHCHQPCKWCYPMKDIYLFVVDDDFIPDKSQAVIPSCN